MTRRSSSFARSVVGLAVALAGAALAAGVRTAEVAPLDKAAERWVASALKSMTLDEKVGQLLVPAFESTYVSSDSDRFEELSKQAREFHAGAFIAFGGSLPVPGVLLNPTYSSVVLGQPLEAASMANRLQRAARLPLLVAADFEFGLGMRISGATTFPRAMAFGAAGDERLAEEAGRIIGLEARAIGVHVNFAPVADVNNNARNPVINTRSFGEDPERVAALATAYARGLRKGGALATLKHFPGHGDTDVDSHLGLPVIRHPRERLERLELVPFRAGIDSQVDAVMTAHIELPALDDTASTPATLSRRIVTGFLRGELGYDGLVFTDSLGMDAVAKMMPPGEAAVRAVQAGNDLVLHSPDHAAAFAAVKAALSAGTIDAAQVDATVTRVLRAKARLGLHRQRLVDLDAVPEVVGGRAHQALADEVSQRSITLIKDDRGQVPLRTPRDAQVLYLSVVDYPTGWAIAAPSRTFAPELRRRWPNVTAIELSDRTTAAELDLVRASAARYDAIVVSVFVRAASSSGRMDLAAPLVRLLQGLASGAAARNVPIVTTIFGNPYVALVVSDLPAVLLTYDFYDRAEASAVRAIAGEAPIAGKLPIALPGAFNVGHGLERPSGSR
jgi:beta-glucosidase-like glycosyl hydrolase